MKSKIYPEVCCEICNEVVHNHFDCPVCKCYAGTDVYDYFDNYVEFACEKCKTQFRIVGRDAEDCDKIEVEIKEV